MKLYRRGGEGFSKLLDISLDVQGTDQCQVKYPAILAPGGEAAGGQGVISPRVLVPDLCCEKLEDTLGCIFIGRIERGNGRCRHFFCRLQVFVYLSRKSRHCML